MAFDAPAAAIGKFMLGKGCKEAGRRPALLVRLHRQFRPHEFYARQAKLGEQQLQASRVYCCACHAAACTLNAASTAQCPASTSCAVSGARLASTTGAGGAAGAKRSRKFAR